MAYLTLLTVKLQGTKVLCNGYVGVLLVFNNGCGTDGLLTKSHKSHIFLNLIYKFKKKIGFKLSLLKNNQSI